MTADGAEVDVTRHVHYTASPSGIVQIDSLGHVRPLAEGEVEIAASTPEGVTASQVLRVEQFTADLPINFPNEVVPLFTKHGCNGGGCHGKSSGQNGFRLSLLGFEPGEDFEFLTKEGRGRRLFPAAPERSLLLVKATATGSARGWSADRSRFGTLSCAASLDQSGHALWQGYGSGRRVDRRLSQEPHSGARLATTARRDRSLFGRNVS